MNSLFRSPFAAVPSATGTATSFDALPDSPSGLLPGWGWTAAAVVLALLALEQSVYRAKKRHLPGPGWTIPVIGKFADSVNPSMEKYKSQWDSGALSVVSVFNIFIVMASKVDYARKIFNSPAHTEPCLVQSMKTILGPESWVFLNGKRHVDFRKGLNPLFTRQALDLYMHIMDSISRDYITEWLADNKADPSPKPLMKTARRMNMHTSLRVFCGEHISNEAIDEINDRYWDITTALELVNFPFAVPGTKVYRAKQASRIAHQHFEHAIARARKAVAAGTEPSCMVEQWISDFTAPSFKGRSDFTDVEMAQVVFTFLFASQDAMSSSLIYGFQHLADHPEVLTKLRAEQAEVRQGDYAKPLTMDMLDHMPYLRAVVRESMRVKPPVTMVPYTATKAFPISDDYIVPAGSMVIPSIYPSLHDPEVFPDPDRFYPERWLDEKGLANANPKNYLVFGAGPHRCIGEQYAASNTALVLANAAVLMNWEHVITPQSEEVEIIATLFPKDGCLMKFTPRA